MDWFFVVLIVIVIIAYLFLIEYLKMAAINKKRTDYQDALAALRKNPTNPALHEQALTIGRIYSSATRNNERVTLFDETALANDIRAVTANAT